jgi:hypothetical protein
MVLNQLLAKRIRADKREKLNRLNEVLAEEAERPERDFSLHNIGKVCEKKNILAARSLYSKQSQDYRSLIQAWETVYKSNRKPQQLINKYEALLEGIPDPALRSIVQSLFIENRELKNENSILKNKTTILLDRRPIKTEKNVNAKEALVLTSSEKAVLLAAFSEEWLEFEGWTIGDSGEVRNGLGRVVLDVGFISAYRKILRYLNN